MASDAPEGEGSNAAVLGVNAGSLFNFHLKVNDPTTVRSLSSKVADALSFGLRAAGICIATAAASIAAAATGTVITVGYLCYKHPEFVMRVVEKALTAPGLQVATVKPGSILVELHCYTEESFRSFMEDFKAKKVQERLNKEFESSGYIGDELEVTMTNYKEACKFLEQISRRNLTVKPYFPEAISCSTAARRIGELLSPESGFESTKKRAEMDAPLELEGPVQKRGKSSASSEAGQSVATTSRTADASMKDIPVKDDDLEGLSLKLNGTDWEALARRLKFQDPEITAFDKENEEYPKKALKMLFQWKRRDGSKATYRVLHAALSHEFVKRRDLAEKFC